MSILFKPIYLKQNKGRGNARRESFENCKNYSVAIMDSDDISCKECFKKEIEVFTENGSIDVVGGQITEFIGIPENITGKRTVPEDNKDIRKYLKKRCPMNHMTVMFRKSAVERAGGYLDWFCNEDYYLWIRMAINGAIFANVSDTLVNVRVGNEMAARRGGWKYFKSEAGIQKYMLKNKLISIPRYLYNIAIRFGGEVMIPARWRLKLFRYLRSNYNADTEKKIQTENSEINLKYPPFSVAMCVYGKDNAKWFDDALASVTVAQTVKPDEIVLVVDGPIPSDIQKVIHKYEKLYAGMTVIYLKKNQGLGNALKIAVKVARNEIIARMDSDDLAMFNRFEIQLRKFI